MELKISVIIPIYNVGKYLEECLESVLNQNFFDYEVICVDDGSTDESLEILDRYAEQSDKICVIHQENKGQSEARNTGIQHASGEYICFLDGDDMLTRDALYNMWKAVKKENIDVLTYEMAPIWYESEWLRNEKNKDAYYFVANEYLGIKMGREFFVEKVEQGDFIDSACLMLINLKWLRENNIIFYPNAIYEDSVFAIECYFHAMRMKHIKDRLYIYRVRNNSTMTEKYGFKHVYYRIWQYSECLRAIYTYAENEREVTALALYAGKSLANIKYINRCLNKHDQERLYKLEGLYGLIAKSIGVAELSINYNDDLKILGLLSEMNSYSKILLYGAGVVGNKIKNYIYINGLSEKIIGFAISQMPNQLYIDGINIKCISEYEVSDEVLVIIAAQENYHMDMLEQAKKCGYHKIRMIDYEMECILDKKLQEL